MLFCSHPNRAMTILHHAIYPDILSFPQLIAQIIKKILFNFSGI